MLSLIAKIFGDPSEKRIKKYQKDLDAIKRYESRFQTEIQTVEEVQARTHALQSLFI